MSYAKHPERYAHAVACGCRCSLSGSSQRGQPARIAAYAELLARRDTHKVLLISGVGRKSIVRLFLKSSFSLALSPGNKCKSAQLTTAAIVQTPLMVKEYFGVSVVSEPRMASAGVEPRMGSSTDKHLPRSTTDAKHICQL